MEQLACSCRQLTPLVRPLFHKVEVVVLAGADLSGVADPEAQLPEAAECRQPREVACKQSADAA